MSASSPFHVTHLQPKTLFLAREKHRKSLTEGITELRSSILADGLKEPLKVRKLSGTRYKVVHGRRRYVSIMELLQLGYRDLFRYIPCHIVRTGDAVDDTLEYLTVNATPTLNPDIKASLIKQLLGSGVSPEQLSVRTGIPRADITRELRASNRESKSIVTNLLTARSALDSGGGSIGLVDGGQINELLAAICSATPKDLALRRKAILMIETVEAFQSGKVNMNQAAKTIVQTFPKVT